MQTPVLPYHYAVYGLTLASDRNIPGLDAEAITGVSTADIQISFGSVPEKIQHLVAQYSTEYFVDRESDANSSPHLVVYSASEGRYFQFCYADGVEFVIDTLTATVWCRWRESLTEEDAALYLLGPVLGFMLRWGGTTCLHASGILVNNNALAITGSSGAGKSTLAAAFATAGYPILTDDILPLSIIDGNIHTQSGYSRLRLFPSSFEHLPELPDELPLLAPGWNKCFLDLSAGNYRFHRNCAPLKVIYVVDWSSRERKAPSITPVTGSTAIPLLAANTYRNELLSLELRKQEFSFLSAVASRIQIRKLNPVDNISAIPLLRDMLIADFERMIDDRESPAAGTANIDIAQ